MFDIGINDFIKESIFDIENEEVWLGGGESLT